MAACRHGICVLVFNFISHTFVALTRKISSWTLEEQFCSQRPRSFRLAVTLSRHVQKPLLNLKSAFINGDSCFVSFFLGCFYPIHGGVVGRYDSKPWHSYYYSLCGCISLTPVSSLRSFVLYRQREYSWRKILKYYQTFINFRVLV